MGDKQITSVYLSRAKKEKWREKYPYLKLSQFFEQQLDLALDYDGTIEKAKEEVEELKGGAVDVREMMKISNAKKREFTKQLERSEELREAVRKWDSMRIRAMNEQSISGKRNALAFKEKIKEQFKINDEDIVKITGGMVHIQSEEEEDDQA